MDQRLVFMGTPAFTLPVLQTLLSQGYRVVGVYTQPDRPSGRGLQPQAPPVKEAALQHGLPVFQPPSLRPPEAQAQLAALKPDLIIVAAYGKILPPQVLAIPPKGCLNLHPSLLPRYRGPSPVVAAILDGLEVTGVSIMLMDQGMDTGPVLAQRSCPIAPQDTAETLTYRLFQLGAELLKEILPGWLRGEVQPVPQDHSQATYTRRIEKEDGQADWSQPAVVLERRLRAFTPWPGLYTRWKGKLLKVLAAVPLPQPAQAPPGTVVRLDSQDTPCGVATGDGILGLRRLQLEGGKAQDARQFVIGYRDFIGSRLPS